MLEFKRILDDTIDSMISVESHRRYPGKLYAFAWAVPDTPECRKIKRRVCSMAKKTGLRTSCFSVFGTSDDRNAMQELRCRIMDEMNLFVSPVTWVPLEEYGKDFFIFAYFPLFSRREFEFVESAGNMTGDSVKMPASAENMFRLESMRLNSMIDDGNNVYQAPFVSAEGSGDKTPVLRCCGRPGRFKEFYEPGDDPEYGDGMSPEEFAGAVIRVLGMEDEYVPDLKLIVSRNPEMAAKLYRLLSTRLNTSWIVNVNLYGLKQCAVSFSFDDSRYDRTACHHSLFYIPNNLIWGI